MVKKVTLIYATMFLLAAGVIFGSVLIEKRDIIAHGAASLLTRKDRTEITTPVLSTKQKEAIEIKEAVQLEAPLIKQLPELPRGCEVVSLGMLLAYHDIEVDKMELAKNVKHNPASYEVKDGKIYFGNPHNGFVGDMYSFQTPGLGVYHKPIVELAKQYAPDRQIVDLTNEDFSSVIYNLNLERPVWIIINADYTKIPKSSFETWYTEDGPIEITYRQHSVLVTGYDEEYIYFNDPLNKRTKANKENFINAWEQMGKQAVTMY